jgi:hypothetical protein
MAKFNEYTVKATPEDADTLMLYDAASKTNKLSPFSGIWNWIVGKLTNAVIANLQTNNKTVLGAINELNSNLLRTVTAEIEDALPDDLPNGLKIAYYNTDTKNSPSNYGVILYLSYSTGTNKWFTAIACTTSNGGIYISSKTNEEPWSKWVKLLFS